jgi:hypothetical protein
MLCRLACRHNTSLHSIKTQKNITLCHENLKSHIVEVFCLKFTLQKVLASVCCKLYMRETMYVDWCSDTIKHKNMDFYMLPVSVKVVAGKFVVQQ